MDEKVSGLTQQFIYRVLERLEVLERTPAWLGRRAGIPSSTIYRLVRGEAVPTLAQALVIARVLGVRLAELVEEAA